MNGERPAMNGERVESPAGEPAASAPVPTLAAAPGPAGSAGGVRVTAVTRPGHADGETDSAVPPTSTL